MALISPNNRAGIAIIAVESIFSLLAIFTVILRVWARKLKGLNLDGSDWTCIFGLVSSLLEWGVAALTFCVDRCSHTARHSSLWYEACSATDVVDVDSGQTSLRALAFL